MIDNWFDSIVFENVIVDFENIEPSFSGDVGFIIFFITFAAQSDKGIELRHIKERMTVYLIKDNGNWLVTNQHASVPIKMDTGSGMFE